MTEQEIWELRRWAAAEIMGWHTKSDKLTSYYYDDQDRRVGTIRNWKPDWIGGGQIWHFLRRLVELGYHYTIYDRPDSENHVARFYYSYGTKILGIGEDKNPCLAIMLGAREAFDRPCRAGKH